MPAIRVGGLPNGGLCGFLARGGAGFGARDRWGLEALAASQNYNRNGSAVEPDGVFGDVRRSGSSSAVNDYPHQRSGRAVYAKQRVGLQLGDSRPNLSDWKPRVSDAPLHLDDKPARLIQILQADVVGLGFACPKRGAAVAVNAYIPGFGQDKRNALFGTAVHETGPAIMSVQVAELVQRGSLFHRSITGAVHEIRS